MGSALSLCGLGAGDANAEPQMHFQRRDLGKELSSRAERARSGSSTTESSIASILSNSERLIPDAYMPRDIQVLSQRRQSHGPHRHSTSRSLYSGSLGVSRRGASSSQSTLTGSMLFARNGNAAVDALANMSVASSSSSYMHGLKSSGLGRHSDEEEVLGAAPATLPGPHGSSRAHGQTQGLV